MKNFWQKINKPIIGLAPMDGVTDFPMREIQTFIAKPDVMFTEFVSIDGFLRAPDKFSNILKYSEKQRPIVVQIFGSDPQLFYQALVKIIPFKFDGIDLNMGCPERAVVKKGAGGALIGNYSLSGEIINSCLRALSESKKNIPLSIKTRIGKTCDETIKWIQHLSSFPLAAITIHGRKLSQGITGSVNWPEIKDVSEIVKNKGIILLGNGGIKSLAEARKRCSENNLDGVLIGQAVLGNPWVFKENFQPTKEEILKTILKHAKLAWDFYGQGNFVKVLKHFGWYPKNFPGSKQLRTELLKTRTINEVSSVLSNFSVSSGRLLI